MVLGKDAHYKRQAGFTQLSGNEKMGGGKTGGVGSLWQAIERAVSDALGEPFRVRAERAVGGGCINEAVCLEGANRSIFVKLNRADRLAMFEAEAAGLAAIRASNSVRAPEPIAWGIDGERCWLALEFLALGPGQPFTGARLGEQLATMHRSVATAFGWERDNTIGSTPQPNPWTADWASFLRQQRIGPQLELARSNGLPASTLDRAERLQALLPTLFDGYHPQASLLHGDLWGGNWAADAGGNPAVFDPAVYFGDRESDLAMTELFGGFDAGFYRAYDRAWPLDPGYETRRDLYQLYHILNHFNLFGGSYASQARALIDRLLK